MMRRALLTELRRGVAPLAMVALAVTGTAVLFNETEQWAGRWSGLAGYVRVALIVLVPVALAAGAWQGGRERRRRIVELLASTPRPSWQHTGLRWGGVAAGVCGGFVVAWAVCAVFVARVATYSGGGWWWQVLVGLVALAAAAAVGFAAGRTVPWRVTAPVLGLAGYVVIGSLSYVEGDDGRGWLSPALPNAVEGAYLPASFHALQAVWFAALGLTALVLVGARRRWTALGPAAVAAAAGALIAAGPGDDRWQDDAAALEPVCVAGTLEVCTTRENAFLLGGLATVAEDVLGRWEGVAGVPARVHAFAHDHEWDGSEEVAGVVLRPYVSWLGTLSRTGEYGASLENDLIANVVPLPLGCPASDADTAVMLGDISHLALMWAGGDVDRGWSHFQDDGNVSVHLPAGEGAGTPTGDAHYNRLTSWPEARQLRWVQRYVAAADSCDVPDLGGLLEELR